MFNIVAKIEDLDQVLLCMATKIGDFVPFIGGPNQAKSLIPLLESLCNAEETQVRSAASLSTVRILRTLGNEHKAVTKEFLEMYKRLVIDDGGEVFYGRVSACQIAPQLFQTLPDQLDKNVVREAYVKLSLDELSIIRRATVQSFIEFCSFSDYELRINELLGMLKHLVADECSAVKIMAVGILPAYAKLLFDMKAFDIISGEIAPLIKASCEDPSWRVKCAVAKDFSLYAAVFAAESIQPIYRSGVQLMTDDEPEVRQLIIPTIFPYSTVLTLDSFLQPLVPMLQLLYDDPVPEVRKAIADLTVDSAVINGTESYANSLADLIVKLLGDEDGFVRLRILSKLKRIAEDVPALLTRLTPNLKNLYGDSNWRVRRAICLGMPAVIGSMGPEYFQNHFINEYLHALKDGVSEVRIAVSETFPAMIEAASAEWFFSHIFASVKQTTKEEYLVRLSVIGGLRAMLTSGSLSEAHQNEVLSHILGYTKDAVPNVRLRAAQALSSICNDPTMDNSKLQTIKPVLQELQADKDKDVKYFSSTAFLLKK